MKSNSEPIQLKVPLSQPEFDALLKDCVGGKAEMDRLFYISSRTQTQEWGAEQKDICHLRTDGAHPRSHIVVAFLAGGVLTVYVYELIRLWAGTF